MLAVVATGTGLLLRFEEARLFEDPWLLGLIPVVNAVGGNLGAVLGARLTSALHLGTIEAELVRGELTDNLALTAAAGVVVYLALATVVYLAGLAGAFPAPSAAAILALVFGTGVGLTLAVIGLSLATAFVAFRRGLDPDDVVVPLVTNAADLLGVLILFGVSGVVL